MSRLNVLALHRMGDPRYRREAVRALEYMILESSGDINCVVHDADLPFPEYLKEIEYHLIVLGPTFLYSRFNPRSLEKIREEYCFITESNACKIALPQDDYDATAILDLWLVDWNVDRLYSVCYENREVLYPKFSKVGEILLGYTGYVTDEWISQWTEPKPHTKRPIDVSYRTHDKGRNRCYLRNLKYEIGQRFREAASAAGADLKLDLSSDRRDLIPGSQWHEFVENSKFCLTTPSGSSVLDPVGALRTAVLSYSERHPGATFEEIQRNCLHGEDRRYMFTAISPRNIEAALAETVQVATPGPYSGLMQPLDHYVPLEEDCSNIKDVLDMMADPVLVRGIQHRCKEAILDEPRLRRAVIVSEILEYARSVATDRNIGGSEPAAEHLFRRYEHEIEKQSKRYWFRHRMKAALGSAAVKLGAGRVRKWLFVKRTYVRSWPWFSL